MINIYRSPGGVGRGGRWGEGLVLPAAALGRARIPVGQDRFHPAVAADLQLNVVQKRIGGVPEPHLRQGQSAGNAFRGNDPGANADDPS